MNVTTDSVVANSDQQRILLVDDNPNNLQVLFQTLNGRGHKLRTAHKSRLGAGSAIWTRRSCYPRSEASPKSDNTPLAAAHFVGSAPPHWHVIHLDLVPHLDFADRVLRERIEADFHGRGET